MVSCKSLVGLRLLGLTLMGHITKDPVELLKVLLTIFGSQEPFLCPSHVFMY